MRKALLSLGLRYFSDKLTLHEQAAITYGDPMAGERTKALGGWGCLPEDRTQVFCNKGDGVCTGAFSISGAHLSYTSNGDIGKGAAFATQIVNGNKMGGNPGGECKYGISINDIPKGEGGGAKAGGGGTKGKGMPGKGTGAPKGAGPKGGGMGGAPAKGSGDSPPAVPPAEAPAAEASPIGSSSVAGPEATGSMPGMEGMEGMRRK
jgi:hypothetical protein